MDRLKEKIIIAASFMDESDTNTLWNLILNHFPNRSWDNIEETVFHKYDSNTLYALHVLQAVSQDKQKRMEYEAREKAVRDYNQGMFEAEQRGEQRGIEIGEQRINTLYTILINSNRMDDLKRAAADKAFQTQLMDELLPKDLL